MPFPEQFQRPPSDDLHRSHSSMSPFWRQAPLSHSHSILSIYRNALIYKRKIFPLTAETRLPSRQNFPLLISKENSRALASALFRRLSTTIGRFFLGQSQTKRGPRTQKDRHNASITRAHHRTGVDRSQLRLPASRRQKSHQFGSRWCQSKRAPASWRTAGSNASSSRIAERMRGLSALWPKSGIRL
jgi:hypothetical protein